MTGLFKGHYLLGSVVLYCRYCIRTLRCHFSVNQKLFNIRLTWVVRGMMDVFHVYCFKSVGLYKYRLSRIESLMILYLGQNCTLTLRRHSIMGPDLFGEPIRLLIINLPGSEMFSQF